MEGFSPVASSKLFCQVFSVSRVPVREALCALELNGLVDSVQGGGVYVREVADTVSDISTDVEPQDIIRVRMLLEPDIAREATLHLDEESRKDLEAIYEKFLTESKTGIISKETDRAFHLALANASGNALYPRIMTMVLSDMEQELWELILSRTIATKRYQDQNNMEHIRICEAVLNGRPDDAHQFMQSHMAMLYERYWSE